MNSTWWWWWWCSPNDKTKDLFFLLLIRRKQKMDIMRRSNIEVNDIIYYFIRIFTCSLICLPSALHDNSFSLDLKKSCKPFSSTVGRLWSSSYHIIHDQSQYFYHFGNVRCHIFNILPFSPHSPSLTSAAEPPLSSPLFRHLFNISFPFLSSFIIK